MENIDIYQKLAKHLDNLPGGFPLTESGVEIRILKRLFSPEDAELALHLTLIPEEPRVIARRAGISGETARQHLEEMAKKGLIFSVYPEKGLPKYQAAHFACGIWEFQVNKLTPEFAQDMEEYWPTFFNLNVWEKTPQFRTIPVNQSITFEHKVMSYEQAEELIKNHRIISLNPCICRQEQGMKGKNCSKPIETCLLFGNSADFFLHQGTGRRITQKEALDVLHLANEHSLVLQPSNSKDVSFLCCCCSCCCAVLRNIKRHPRPASIVSTPFVAYIDEENCTGCEICIDRCQMEAIKKDDGKVTIDVDRCIGCGLCVSKCPVNTINLFRKSQSDQKEVPKNLDHTYIKLAKDRGKLNTASMIGILVKSKVDRLFTLR